MFKAGQRYRIYKTGALELKDKKWINAVVEHIPSHGRFVRFRMHFVNCFGERTSYVESFTMNELAHMAKSGELVKR
ncbi:hypothetical protein [uncultured Eubacterium sp.]|uniref:hypothetical protein n=1 Tax=uncultured Eubacterium sp. TaxID=165185 RepID=UPI002595D185|nr:hypothetical protein [uncultured Eubacterium sp.]